MRVAIVTDWLVGGGGERVVQELHKIYPEAPIYTSYCTKDWRNRLDGKVVTGCLQAWPFSKLRKFLPLLRIWWFTHLKFNDYGLVISVSGNGEAKSIRTPEDVTHINYCHTPTHYYWRHYDQYMKQPGFGIFNPLARFGLWVLVKPLRAWDKKAAQRADLVIANSTHTQSDIKKYYDRDSAIVFPPVDTDRFASAQASRRQGFLTMGRLVGYKRVDLIVSACAQLDLPLKVIGRGPELSNLQKLAGPKTEFLTTVSDQEMPEQLASAEAFIFAGFEDFGVAPVEGLAAGTPLIAYKAGGALDYVIEGQSGEFFEEQTVESLMKTLKKFDPKKYSAAQIKAVAEHFSAKEFTQKWKLAVAEKQQ